jgi:hypothetical protein
MAKKDKKKSILDEFNNIFTLLKNSICSLGQQEIVEKFSDVSCREDILLFSNQIQLQHEKLAKRDISLLQDVFLLKPLVECSIFIESKETEEENDEKIDSLNNLFEYIELMYKSGCNTKQYNMYMNTRNKELDTQETILKKKMKKEMKKMYPCFKRIVETVDKEAIKELMEMMKTKKFVNIGQQVAMRLLKNGFDIDEAFKEFDLEKFTDLTASFSDEK